MKKIVSVRGRGQITIPNKIRDQVDWAKEGSVLLVTALINEIKITPFLGSKTNWDEIWGNIRKVRYFRGKRGNLSSFIAKDRKKH